MRKAVSTCLFLIPALIWLGVEARTAADPRVLAPPESQDPMAYQEVHNTLTSEEKAQGFALLFDGKTTSGWRGYQQERAPEGWQVADGALTRVGGGGDLITVDQYDSFDLRIDWKIDRGGNSGIMYHVTETGGATYHTGPEYQILDNAAHADGKDTLTSTGSCYALYAPVKDVTRPAGNWNETRLVVNGNQVEHWLNGVRLVEYELHSPDWNQRVAGSKFKQWPEFGRAPRGHLALQDHGDRVAFRNIRIRVLKR